jgi:malic enzyme
MCIRFVSKANNAYIFPGTGLGIIVSGTIRVHDDIFLAAGKNTWPTFNGFGKSNLNLPT